LLQKDDRLDAVHKFVSYLGWIEDGFPAIAILLVFASLLFSGKMKGINEINKIPTLEGAEKYCKNITWDFLYAHGYCKLIEGKDEVWFFVACDTRLREILENFMIDRRKVDSDSFVENMLCSHWKRNRVERIFEKYQHTENIVNSRGGEQLTQSHDKIKNDLEHNIKLHFAQSQ